MFKLTKLTKDSQVFLTSMRYSTERKTLIPLAIGRCLSTTLLLPSAPVTNLNEFFIQNCRGDINNFLSSINEYVLLDIQACSDAAFKFYQFRYNSAFPVSNVLAFNADTSLVDFFKLSNVFSKETLDLISKSGPELSYLINSFNKLYIESKEDLT